MLSYCVYKMLNYNDNMKSVRSRNGIGSIACLRQIFIDAGGKVHYG